VSDKSKIRKREKGGIEEIGREFSSRGWTGNGFHRKFMLTSATFYGPYRSFTGHYQ